MLHEFGSGSEPCIILGDQRFKWTLLEGPITLTIIQRRSIWFLIVRLQHGELCTRQMLFQV